MIEVGSQVMYRAPHTGGEPVIAEVVRVYHDTVMDLVDLIFKKDNNQHYEFRISKGDGYNQWTPLLVTES